MYEELIQNLRGDFGGEYVKDAADAMDEMNQCLDGISADNDSLCKQIIDLNKTVEHQRDILMQFGGETGIRDMAEVNNDLWNALAKRRWIPVTERLPEKPDGYPNCEIRRCYYMVSLESGCVKTLGFEFDRNEWHTSGSPVAAWMPLPEPYKPTCGDCYWYSDITVHVCDREKEPTSEDQEACPMFEPKES